MVTLASKIEVRRTASLKPYSRNARHHSKSQVRQIANSIRRFGFTNPVLISDDDEIIAGHGRVMAAKEIGLSDGHPMSRLDDLLPWNWAPPTAAAGPRVRNGHLQEIDG